MRYQSDTDVNMQGPGNDEYMQIIFCLNDGVSWGIMNEPRSITLQKMNLVFMQGLRGRNIFVIRKTVIFLLRP